MHSLPNLKKNKDRWEDRHNKLETKIASVSSPGVRRTYCVNPAPICVHKRMIKLRSKLLFAGRSVMLQLNFGVPALVKMTVLEFPCTQLRVFAMVSQPCGMRGGCRHRY